jgi:hypothetical protein
MTCPCLLIVDTADIVIPIVNVYVLGTSQTNRYTTESVVATSTRRHIVTHPLSVFTNTLLYL